MLGRRENADNLALMCGGWVATKRRVRGRGGLAGKTASLKALGLAAVMSKAGLFLPLAPASPAPHLLWFDKASPAAQRRVAAVLLVGMLCTCMPCIHRSEIGKQVRWNLPQLVAALHGRCAPSFTAHVTLPGVGRSRQGSRRRAQVLADVGDGQSLQQSLSTFSAHMRRLRLILAAATPASLALLDEVGSGTPLTHHTSHLARPPSLGRSRDR